MAKRTIKRSSNQGVTLDHHFKEFIAEKEARNLSEATIRNYVQSYNMLLFFNEFSPSITAEDVSVTHVHHLITRMKECNISPASINHYLRDCRAFLYWCMSDERGYMQPFKIALIKGQEEQPKLFTDDELQKLLAKPNIGDPFTTWRTWVIVNWVLGTGNRSSTICDVHMNDVDYSSKEITLRHTKNKKAQIIPLSPSLELALKEYIRIWRSDADEDGWLFPNVCDRKLTTNALRHSFAKYCVEREVDKTNIHGLRHNFAKGWVRNNGNMFVLQKILGHRTLDMTKRYVRLFSDDIKENFDQYAPLDTMNRANKRTYLVKRKK